MTFLQMVLSSFVVQGGMKSSRNLLHTCSMNWSIKLELQGNMESKEENIRKEENAED